ncbi:hypothetical protein TNCV_2833451 [Trichonephila clavipes]|nr:hypothetical protein TNCV_2833451 [Trichonephila clavipes]
MVDCGSQKNTRASATWKSPQSSHRQKFCQDRSKEKVMLEAFFDIQGIVHLEFIPEERTANKHLYVVKLRHLRAPIRKKRSKLWAEQSLMGALHENAPAHCFFLIPDFLQNPIWHILLIPLISSPATTSTYFLSRHVA